MPAKTADDIRGLEYDWLAVDDDDHVALLSTAGGGHAPAGFLDDTDAHDGAIAALLASPATTRCRFAPVLRADLDNTWRRAAERGLYAFDGDPNGGPYRLVAAPEVPVLASEPPNGSAASCGALRSRASGFPTSRGTVRRRAGLSRAEEASVWRPER